MADPQKCAHPACSCIPPDKEKYCSAHCEAMADKVEITCQCGHAHCTGMATKG